jgi:hypothetical protein
MNQEIRAEIERVAHELYERSGREEGKDLINWLAAEKIVLGRLVRSGRIAGEDAGAKKSRRHGAAAATGASALPPPDRRFGAWPPRSPVRKTSSRSGSAVTGSHSRSNPYRVQGGNHEP